MKNLICLLFLLPFMFYGQTQSENYVKTTIYKIPVTTSVTNPPITTAHVFITYFDALGRPKQKIASKESATGKNIILPFEYDSFGRETKTFLPYRSTGSGFDIEANNVLGYYAAPTLASTGSSTFESTSNPYKEYRFDNSPLNRVEEMASVGNDWNISLGKTARFNYKFNIADVKLFKANASWDPSLELYTTSLINGYGSVYYPANELTKMAAFDENVSKPSETDKSTLEYRNSDGQVVLKRIYAGTVKYDTYSVYDQYGNLTYVIPPAAATGNVSAEVLDKLCYQYRYDSRNRLVEKKLPGKQWEFIIYDNLDRVVATGPVFCPFSQVITDSNLGWMIVKYDKLNRKIYTGWMSAASINSTTRKTLQSSRNLETVNLSETKIQTTTDTSVNGVAFRYTNVAWPIGSSYHVLTVNYFDDYNFPNAPSPFPSSVMNDGSQNVYYNNSDKKPKGLSTGSWVRAITTTSATAGELSYNLYDNKAMVVRKNSINYLGGLTRIDNKINFEGKVIKTEKKHKRLTGSQEINITNNYTYTNQGWLFTNTHQITGQSLELISENAYDEFGKLISKKVGNNNNGSYLEKIDYSYNIRGWLTGINNDPTNLAILNAAENDLLALKINYNKIENYTGYTGQALYDGNIAETYWRTSTDNVLRKYGYKYDKLNRLKEAIYMRPENSTKVTNSYNETVSYDINGNITNLYRTGDFDSQSQTIPIDDLTFFYKENNTTNRLSRIVDNAGTNSSLGFSADINEIGRDVYDYDDFGNLIRDANKGINSNGLTPIKYNHLNLPTEIVFSTSPLKKINYIYDGRGNKLQRILTNGTTISTTDYLDGFHYKNETLLFFSHAGGYVNYDSGVYKYVYNYLDHLKNVRLSYVKNTDINNSTPLILEQNHYYPYGLKHTNYNTTVLKLRGNTVEVVAQASIYKYKFNGKEYQDDFGLKTTAMDFRQYDAAIGRFNTIDALAEADRNKSPYSFAWNNPVAFNDPSGLSPDDYCENDDDTEWNLYLDHTGEEGFTPASFDGGFGPMNGELKEVVVGASGKGYDRYEEPDRDGFGDKEDDREKAEKAIREMADTYMNIGTVCTLVGVTMVATGIGAPVGIGLMAMGSAFGASGAGLDIIGDISDEEDFDWGGNAMNVGSELVPGAYEDLFSKETLGADNVLIEAGAAASDWWMDFLGEQKGR